MRSLLIFGALATSASANPPDADARQAEAEGRWHDALAIYLQPQARGNVPFWRERVRECARRSSQGQRWHDPAYTHLLDSLRPADALNLYAEVLTELHTHYRDADRVQPAGLLAAGVDELGRALADPVFRNCAFPDINEAAIQRVRQLVAGLTQGGPAQSVDDARQRVRELLVSLQREHPRTHPASVVMEMLCGACHSLDEATTFEPCARPSLSPTPLVELASSGLALRPRQPGYIVEAVTPGSWADRRTPVQAGDRLLRVDGRPLSATITLDALWPPAPECPRLEFIPARGMISFPRSGATLSRIEIGPGPIAYVEVSRFTDSTPAEFSAALASCRAQGIRSLILDLRDNGGGSFPAALEVTQALLGEGLLSRTAGRHAYFAQRQFHADGRPGWEGSLIVLIAARTASAAEVVAAALAEHPRATLIGTPTFGKGSIQTRRRLGGDSVPGRGTLVLTVADAFSPRGDPLQGVGVTPHLRIEEPAEQLATAQRLARQVALP